MTEPTTDHVTLHLASVLPSVETVEQTAESFAQRAGFDEDDIGHIALVCREAAVNAVVHGNKYDPGKEVTADFDLTDDALSVRIGDQGAGFNPNELPDPLAEENLLRTSGRGVFLMRAIMDEVHFRQLTPGTEITLKKHRIAREADK